MATKGIDVSYWNTIRDWSKVKASGIDFCYVRAGQTLRGRRTIAANTKGARRRVLPSVYTGFHTH